MPSDISLDHIDTQQLRILVHRLMDDAAAQHAQLTERDQIIVERDRIIQAKQIHIDQLMHELAMYKRWRYGKRSEQLNAAQLSLLQETMDEDMTAIEQELDTLRDVSVSTPPASAVPRRLRLPDAVHW